MTWDVPVADNCPDCGQTMFKLSGKGARKPFCINEKCKNFLPEDKRGYKRKPKTDDEKASADGTEKKTATKKTTAKKTAAKKPVKKKTTARKPAAKKATATKATTGKPPAKKKPAEAK